MALANVAGDDHLEVGIVEALERVQAVRQRVGGVVRAHHHRNLRGTLQPRRQGLGRLDWCGHRHPLLALRYALALIFSERAAGRDAIRKRSRHWAEQK